MAASESILLRRFAEHGDTEAFSEIVRRYADSVYSTCRRILFDEAGAADAAQETFYQLMCNAKSIKGSLSGWLHSVATRQAITTIRQNASRRARERRYAFSKVKEVNQWKDISPYIDKELEKLPPHHKDVLMQYFFEGKTMSEIAAIDGVSQPTVSRQVNAAVEALRKRFRKKGLIISTIVLGTLMEHTPLHAVPATLLTEAGKMSLIGTTSGLMTPSTTVCSGITGVSAVSGSLSAFSAGIAKAAVSTAFSTLKAKAATTVAIIAVGTGAVITYNVSTHDQDAASDVHTEILMDSKQIADEVHKEDLTVNQPIVLNQISVGGGYGGGGMVARAAGNIESGEIPIKLTDPETTIDTFTELLVTDNLDRWADCFIPDSQALVRLSRIMTNPKNQTEQQLQDAFNSIGGPVETLNLTETENGLGITLLYTVYDPFMIDYKNEKHIWQEGDQFEIDAEVVNVDNKWKIDNISTAYKQ